MTDFPALPPQPIPPDLVKEMAMDIGKEVAAYIERMYPEAVKVASSSFLLALRNSVYNQIMAALATTDPIEIERRLKVRKQQRRKLRAMVKATRDMRHGDTDAAMAVVEGRVVLEPDL
jgi:hypothetical protein